MTRAFAFEPYALTPFDHLLSLFYGGCALSFRVPCPNNSVPSLCASLDRLIVHLPFLTGQVAPNGKGMGVHPLPQSVRGSSPPLYIVRHFPNLRLPSKTKNRNPCSEDYLRDESLVLAPRTLCALAGTPVVRFQINVLADGIILVLWVNHMAIDGTGVGKVIQALAVCCQAEIDPSAIQGLPTDPAAEAATRAILAGFGTDLPTSTEAKVETDQPPALGASVTNDSSLVDFDFCFSASRVQKLKDSVRRLVQEDKRTDKTELDVSCDDIVTAFLWMSLSRIWQHNSREHPSNNISTVTRAVDVRQRLNTPVPETYMGNCVILPKETIPLEQLHWSSPDPESDEDHLCSHLAFLLTRPAGILRAHLQSINGEYIRGIFSPTGDPETSSSGPQVFVSSIRHMKVYEHDFGPLLGHPEGVDLLPYMRPDAVCTIKPKRSERSDWDISVTLNKKDMVLLTEDPWFGWLSITAAPFRVFESV